VPRGTVDRVNTICRADLKDESFEQGFVFEVPFAFASKSNFRRYSETTRTNSWSRFRSFEDAIFHTANAARPADWLNPGVELTLALRPVIVVVLYARTTLDASNLPKSVLDALQGVLYANDAQVRHVSSFTTRTTTNKVGYAGVARLAAGASNEEIIAAAAALTELSWRWWSALGHDS
jgi:Holliday junction resolvase RusA-like endonuclease